MVVMVVMVKIVIVKIVVREILEWIWCVDQCSQIGVMTMVVDQIKNILMDI